MAESTHCLVWWKTDLVHPVCKNVFLYQQIDLKQRDKINVIWNKMKKFAILMWVEKSDPMFFWLLTLVEIFLKLPGAKLVELGRSFLC